MTDDTKTPDTPSRPPSRAKRHLRLVTASPEAGEQTAAGKGRRKAAAAPASASGGRGVAGKGRTQGQSSGQVEGEVIRTRGAKRVKTLRSGVVDRETGITAKQLAFAEGVASGMTLSDAYRAAYDARLMTDKSVWEASCRMLQHFKVRARLDQIAREREEARRMLATSDAASALETLRRMMTEADSDATKVRAAELLAKSAGVFTERVEIEDKTDRSASEIEQAIADRLRRLGLAS
jgi:hypothetical protein